MEKIDFANILFELSKNKKEMTAQEIIKQKYAIEKKEFLERKKRVKNIFENFKSKNAKSKLSCLHFSWKKYESFEKEQEYWEEQYKRTRELLNN